MLLPGVGACGGAAPAPAGSPALASPPATAAEAAPAAAAPAAAAPAPPPALVPLDDAEIARIEGAPFAVKSNWVPPGKSERFGHAEIVIHGDPDEVRKVLLDFGHYKDIVPRKFKNAHVIAKEKGRTDLYMQVPIMHGMIMLWDVLRFSPITLTERGERLEGTFVRGNVRDANIVMTMRGVAPKKTLLTCDLLILPKVPAPQSAIDEELRDAAGDALDGIKGRVEQPSVSPPPQPPAPQPASPPPAPG
jgi:hypothetical protein